MRKPVDERGFAHLASDQARVRGRLVARNAILNLSGQIGPLLVAVAVIPYVIHRLGTAGFGILSIAWILLGYFNLFDLGVSRAVTKFVAEYLNPLRLDRIPGLFWTSFTLQMVLGVIGALAITALVPFAVEKVFKIPFSWAGDARTSFYILALALPILLASNIFRSVLEAAQRFDLINAVRVPATICTYLLAALAVYLGFRVAGIVVFVVVARFATTFVYAVLCFKIFPVLREGMTINVSLLRSVMGFGGWIVVSNIASPTFQYLERLLIASLLSVSALAFYSAPFELISRMSLIPLSLGSTLFPFFSYHGRGGSEIVTEISVKSCKFLLFILTPATLVVVCFAHQILLFWLGLNFANQGVLILQLLAIAFFLNAFAFIPHNSVQALGRPDLKALLDVVMLPVYAMMCWFLVEKMGINGAALAKLIATVIDVIFLFWFSRRLRAFPPMMQAAKSLYRGLAVCVALSLLVFLVKGVPVALPVTILLLALLLSGYAISFWELAVDESERAVLRNFPRSLLLQIRRIEDSQ